MLTYVESSAALLIPSVTLTAWCAWLLPRAPFRRLQIFVTTFLRLSLALLLILVIETQLRTMLAPRATLGGIGAQSALSAIPEELFKALAFILVRRPASRIAGFTGMGPRRDLRRPRLLDARECAPMLLIRSLQALLAYGTLLVVWYCGLRPRHERAAWVSEYARA